MYLPPKEDFSVAFTIEYVHFHGIKCERIFHFCEHLRLSLLNVSVKTGHHDKDVSALPVTLLSTIWELLKDERKNYFKKHSMYHINYDTEREDNMRSGLLLNLSRVILENELNCSLCLTVMT